MIPLEFHDATDKENHNHGRHLRFLYDLLRERLDSANVNISHRRMPSYEDHCEFVERGSGYAAFWVIANEGDPTQLYASFYVTERREVGLFVAKGHQGKGYGKWILSEFLKEFPGEYFANIHPENCRSKRFFRDMGFEPCQHTYRIST